LAEYQANKGFERNDDGGSGGGVGGEVALPRPVFVDLLLCVAALLATPPPPAAAGRDLLLLLPVPVPIPPPNSFSSSCCLFRLCSLLRCESLADEERKRWLDDEEDEQAEQGTPLLLLHNVITARGNRFMMP